MSIPPCEKGVVWNVLSTIYPISKEHLRLFKKILSLNKGYDMAKTGNYRLTQKPNSENNVVIFNGPSK